MFQNTLSVSFHAAVYLIVLSTEIRTPIPTIFRGSYQLDDREEKMFVRLPLRFNESRVLLAEHQCGAIADLRSMPDGLLTGYKSRLQPTHRYRQRVYDLDGAFRLPLIRL